MPPVGWPLALAFSSFSVPVAPDKAGTGTVICYPDIDFVASLAFEAASIAGLSFMVLRGLSARIDILARLLTKLLPAKLIVAWLDSDWPAMLRAGLAYALAFWVGAGSALEAPAPPSAPSLVGERAANVDVIWNLDAPAVDIGGFDWAVADDKPVEYRPLAAVLCFSLSYLFNHCIMFALLSRLFRDSSSFDLSA